MSNLVLVSTVSWEDRFLEGLRRIVRREAPRAAVLFRYDGWGHSSDSDCRRAEAVCRDAGCDVRFVVLDHEDQAGSWRLFRREVLEIKARKGHEVLIDVSTMPREMIWTLLLLLENAGVGGRYVYHRPERYGQWLSRDPEKPRLAMKLSGEMRFGVNTVLLVTTGFDRERTDQLVRTFEPAVMELAIQSGTQFANDKRNVARHEQGLRWKKANRDVRRFNVDAYSGDHGYGAIAERIEAYVGRKNIVMASLGPKLSAIALYRVQRRFPMSALVYSPAREYNMEYSRGIGEASTGRLPFG